jgi:hypothetical protein
MALAAVNVPSIANHEDLTGVQYKFCKINNSFGFYCRWSHEYIEHPTLPYCLQIISLQIVKNVVLESE